MPEELGREECDELLREMGSGVLSLTDGAETYAVPMSFGYDGGNLYFQFVYDEDSRKASFIESTDVSTFTVYTETPPRSVVVRGTLEPVTDDEALAAAALSKNAVIPSLNVGPEESVDDLVFEFYQLSPEEITGRAFEMFAASEE
ncbi:pyridoxamine 5'-phosphate oxidase family protein [Natronomonas amylolytica]|uniref:pyridoxamine 5'-phosphate oxidase family protein n=1 Tax=Natronomonas amylolytica TaxID=3108498 RepID=UPI0030092B19